MTLGFHLPMSVERVAANAQLKTLWNTTNGQWTRYEQAA